MLCPGHIHCWAAKLQPPLNSAPCTFPFPWPGAVPALNPDPQVALDQLMDYYARLATASEVAGLGLCAVAYTFQTGNASSYQLLAKIQTGEPRPGRLRALSAAAFHK